MIDKILIKYLRWRGWFIVQPDTMSHEDSCTADARGYLTGYPQFGRVAQAFDEVDVFVVIKKEKEDEDK